MIHDVAFSFVAEYIIKNRFFKLAFPEWINKLNINCIIYWEIYLVREYVMLFSLPIKSISSKIFSVNFSAQIIFRQYQSWTVSQLTNEIMFSSLTVVAEQVIFNKNNIALLHRRIHGANVILGHCSNHTYDVQSMLS